MRKLLFVVLTVFFTCQLGAQSRTLTGKVVDEKGAAVAYATVRIKGTNTGLTADSSGNFTIQAKNGDVLEVSATGSTVKEIAVSSENNISIILSSSNAELSAVVVTAFGITRNEKALGYSVSKVDPGELVQKSEPDVLKNLQGKVAGVDIRTSQGTPGAATRIQLRGNSSFFGGNQPLIVVDGIPYSNSQVSTSSQTSGGTAYSSGISNLDPNDIASLNVLKGSAAAALYGSRASDGVLIITTKSGSAKRSNKGLEVTYKSSFSIENIANLPDYQNLYGAGSQFGYSNSNGSWGPAFTSRDSIPTWPDYKGAFPDQFGDSIAYRAYPDNVKDLFQTGKVYENSIGFNGGDEKNAFALTASQLNQTGYVPNSSYKRSNLSMGGSSKLSNGLTVTGNFAYTKSNQKGGYFGENQVDGAASQFARTLFLARNWDLNLPYQDATGHSLTPNGGGQFDNPRWSSVHNVASTQEERLVAGMHLDYKFTPWFSAGYTLGTNVNRLFRKEIIDRYSRAAEGVGQITEDAYRFEELQSDLLLTFTPKINDDFTLKVIVGNSANQRTTTRQVNRGKTFNAAGIYTLANTTQHFADLDVYERRRLMGVFADASVGYKNYAFIDITGRNDWSSTLPRESRSYFYPAFSGSFVFSDAFGIKSNVFTLGKIRAGWARVGRDADPYQLQDVFVLGNNFLGQPTASTSSTKYNPDLTPEFTREFELGTQLSFFKSRIDVDFAYYNKISTDLIAPITTPASSGYSSFVTNYGKISNKGVEIDLNVIPLSLKDFTWTIHGAFTKNVSKVVTLTNGVDRIALAGILSGTVSPYLEAGMPFGYLRGTKVLRDESGNILINPATGGMIVDPNEDIVGDPNPDFKLGITNTFNYKNFFLSALFDMTKGGDMYSVTITSLLGRGVTEDTKDRETSWVIPGVYGDPNTGEPILSDGKPIVNQTRITTNDLYFSPDATAGATFGINTATEWNIYDATVYRLREVSLGYDFPKSVFKKLPIGGLTLSVTGRNIWYIAPNIPKYTNFDPEVNSFGSSTTQGIELSAAPTARRFGVNLSVTF